MNIAKMMQEAKKMQDALQKKTKEFEAKEFEYNYKNSIQIKILGSLKILSITIDKTIVDPDDKTFLEEMVAEAVNEAVADLIVKKDEITKAAIPGMPGGMF